MNRAVFAAMLGLAASVGAAQSNSVAFIALRSEYSNLTDVPASAIITDQAGLDAFWPKLTGYGPRTAPYVDFAKWNLVVVVDGVRPTLGYDIKIADVYAVGPSAAVVQAVELAPDPKLASAEQVNTPYGLVKIAKAYTDISIDILPPGAARGGISRGRRPSEHELYGFGGALSRRCYPDLIWSGARRAPGWRPTETAPVSWEPTPRPIPAHSPPPPRNGRGRD